MLNHILLAICVQPVRSAHGMSGFWLMFFLHHIFNPSICGSTKTRRKETNEFDKNWDLSESRKKSGFFLTFLSRLRTHIRTKSNTHPYTRDDIYKLVTSIRLADKTNSEELLATRSKRWSWSDDEGKKKKSTHTVHNAYRRWHTHTHTLRICMHTHCTVWQQINCRGLNKRCIHIDYLRGQFIDFCFCLFFHRCYRVMIVPLFECNFFPSVFECRLLLFLYIFDKRFFSCMPLNNQNWLFVELEIEVVRYETQKNRLIVYDFNNRRIRNN